ncbi:MAG: NrdH-redoxin [Lactobacillaceae bacterium]|jgi:glutaredoxin-like protein NrdH|nr:NrdH-redoxin [Lactobacillaceae bacterium]
MTHEITVFTKDGCVPCKMTKATLEKLGLQFKERNINHDDTARDELIAQGFQSVPLVFIDGKPEIKGFRPDLLAKIA